MNERGTMIEARGY